MQLSPCTVPVFADLPALFTSLYFFANQRGRRIRVSMYTTNRAQSGGPPLALFCHFLLDWHFLLGRPFSRATLLLWPDAC
jgi:hypothetical protein